MAVTTTPRLYRASEVAALLSVSRERVLELVASGELFSIRLGGTGWHRLSRRGRRAADRWREGSPVNKSGRPPERPARNNITAADPRGRCGQRAWRRTVNRLDDAELLAVVRGIVSVDRAVANRTRSA